MLGSNGSRAGAHWNTYILSTAGGPDVIDLANLNVHIDIPMLNKAGRGTDFTYNYSYDSSVWYPVGTAPNQTWVNAYNWGFRAQTEVATGYASYYIAGITDCFDGGGHKTGSEQNFNTWVYHDQFGIPHPVDPTQVTQVLSGTCSSYTPSFVLITKDGAGVTLHAVGNSSATVTTTKGRGLTIPVATGVGAASGTDRNGNEITVDGTGHFTDTTGNVVLTVSGTAPSPTTLTYTAPSGASASFTISYVTYTVKTAFGCANITDYGATSNPLVDRITLPDGTYYAFTYEATPGTPGDVTGRVASVRYPTGGTITYTYTGGSSGHINCTDGSNSGLTRVTPDSTTAWTYARAAGTGAAYTTTVTDPAGNQTAIQFQGIYETQRKTYQGTTAGTLLQTTNTCYNAAAQPCTGTAITLPITQRDVYVQLGTQVAKHTTKYDPTYQMLTEQDDYDYGSGAPGGLLSQELITYASLTNGIVSAPSQVTTQNGATTAQTKYIYDDYSVHPLVVTGAPQHSSIPSGSRGNPTSVARLVQGTTSLTTSSTYDDAGNVRVATDVNGAQTTYNYSTSAATCGFAFPSSVTEPLSMSRSFTWNCTGGVQKSVTDENGQVTSTGYTTDPYFWRPNSTTDALSNTTSLSYGTNPSTFVSTMTFNGGASVVETGLAFDGLGRQIIMNHQHAPGVSVWDQVQQTYDALGRLYQISMPCVSTGTFTCPMGPSDHVTTNVYDALGRPTQTTDGEGGTTSYTYTNNDVFVTVSPAPTKSRQIQYDGLNRITSVCEITSLTGSGACAQNSSAAGYWTKYAYGPGNVVTVTQNAQAGALIQQTRTYNYDDLGRLTSETNPESGTTTYTYDVVPSGCFGAGAPSAGDLVGRQDLANDNVCFQYDLLHRVTNVGSRTGCKRFAYDNGTITASRPSGITITNAIGRMNEAETDNCSASPPTPITDEWFSYTARGEILDLWESTPHSVGYYPVAAAYWPNGPLSGLVGANGYSMTWGVDGEGRTSSAGSGSPLFGTTYNAASQPTQLSFSSANSDGDTFTYDSTGRMKSYTYTVNSQSVTGSLTWNANGTLSSLLITDPFNAANMQNCTYSHDDLVRIASVNCGASTWQQNFTYDPFGNITKTVPTGGTGISFTPTYDETTNHISSIPGGSITYDANGDVTSDSIHAYTWDAFGNATTIDGNGMFYDALDRMVEQNRPGSNTEFIYAPTGFKMQIMNGQSATADFVPLPGGASVVYLPSGVHYRHPDWLGSSRFATTTSRTVLSDLAYAPFGEPYAQIGTDLSFTGMNSDTSAGLYDFLYREYSTQGRWSSPDPAGLGAVDQSNPQSWNRYSYVSNGPTEFIDPLGYCQTTKSGIKIGCTGIFMGDAGAGPFGLDVFDLLDFAFAQTPDRFGGYDFPTYGNLGVLALLANSGGSANQGASGSVALSGDLGALQYQQYQGQRLLGNFKPYVCGGGYFVGRGIHADGPINVGAYVVTTGDTQSGTSIGYLYEGGVGPLSGGKEEAVNVSSGRVETTKLGFVEGEHVGLFAGAGSDTLQLGAFGDYQGRFGGLYLDIMFGGCHQ